MTVTNPEALPSGAAMTVHDEFGPVPFEGVTVADLSWSYETAMTRNFSRWTDLTLYKVTQDDARYAYLVQIVGRSIVYHRIGGSCPHGVNLTVAHLRRDEDRYEALEACPLAGCRPTELDDLQGTDMVAVEEPRYTLYKCRTAADVVHELLNRTSHGRRSNLSAKLLQAASDVDDDIKAALMKRRL